MDESPPSRGKTLGIILTPGQRRVGILLLIWMAGWWLGPVVFFLITGAPDPDAAASLPVVPLMTAFNVGFGVIYIAGLIADRTIPVRHLRLPIWAGAAGAAAFAATSVTPFGYLFLDYVLGLANVAAVVFMARSGYRFWAWHVEENRPHAALFRMMLLTSVFGFVFLLCLATGVGRGWYAWRTQWWIDGVVTETYRSHNHGALGVAVNEDGKISRFEPVNKQLWERLKRGDHLAKKPGSPFGELNGERVRVVNPPERTILAKEVGVEPEP